MRILLFTCGMIAISSSLRSLYLKSRLDVVAAFLAVFVVTAVVKSALGSRQRDKTVEAAETWAEADAKKIKVMPRAVADRQYPAPPVCMVTGGNGMVGRRVIEMLIERGARRVVCLDIAEVPKQDRHPSGKVEYQVGDIQDLPTVVAACKGVECVFHIAALVGPFFPHAMYMGVNYRGTQNVIAACLECGVGKLVDCSSPSTRFKGGGYGGDVTGQTEAEMPYPSSFSHEYARTKALGEQAVLHANGKKGKDIDKAWPGVELLTCAVAPHQVYGPTDTLFLPAMLDTASSGKLRIFGRGDNYVSFTHVDNIAHGLLCGANALKPEAKACGRFYVVTDGSAHRLWDVIDTAVEKVGMPSLKSKAHLPTGLLYVIAHLGELFTAVTGKFVKLTPFTIRMLIIHRYFDIGAARKDLGYSPIVGFEEGWKEVVAVQCAKRGVFNGGSWAIFEQKQKKS